MTKEELTLEVIRRLKVAYPLAECTLDYDQAWKLLVSVRLLQSSLNSPEVITFSSSSSMLRFSDEETRLARASTLAVYSDGENGFVT